MYPDHLRMEAYEGIKVAWHAIFGPDTPRV